MKKTLLSLGVGIVALILLIFATSLFGGHCRSVECSFINRDGTARPGQCGSIKGDDDNCYCIANDDVSKHQKQLGCSFDEHR